MILLTDRSCTYVLIGHVIYFIIINLNSYSDTPKSTILGLRLSRAVSVAIAVFTRTTEQSKFINT